MVSNRIADQAGELSALRLTSLSHGGGCGCKLAPAVLEQIIAKTGQASGLVPPQLLVGIETSDDPILHFRSRAYRSSVGRRAAAG